MDLDVQSELIKIVFHEAFLDGFLYDWSIA